MILARELPEAAITAGLREGMLQRVRRGAYIEGPFPENRWERGRQHELARCVAVARQSRSSAVLSHRSAALLHGAWVRGVSSLADVYLPYKSRSRPADLRPHRADPLPEDDIVHYGGIALTSRRRTALDYAKAVHPREGLAVADSLLRMAVRPDLDDRAAVERRNGEVVADWETALAAMPSLRGSARARAVLSIADPLAESGGESNLRWALVSNGVPQPALQARIVTDSGDFFGDMGWNLLDTEPAPGAPAVIAEYDGAQKYGADGGRAALVAEKRREDAIRALGIIVARFTVQDLRNPRGAAQKVLCHLHAQPEGLPQQMLALAALR